MAKIARKHEKLVNDTFAFLAKQPGYLWDKHGLNTRDFVTWMRGLQGQSLSSAFRKSTTPEEVVDRLAGVMLGKNKPLDIGDQLDKLLADPD